MTLIQPFLQEVARMVLPNGLTVLASEQPGTGVVAIVCWVRAGYFHEADEVAGMAHLIEHMFFKGSERFPGAEEIARHVSALGGTTNAATIYDATHYYFVLPSAGFERGVEIQADAILAPRFDPEELAREAEVVIEESNRKLDNPSVVATERMYATAFHRHRMRRWRIGSHEVLRAIRRDALVEFFEGLYRPANMIVAVAGDVTPERAFETVARTFGSIPAGEVEKERGGSEPAQREFRFSESRGDIRQSFSVFGWHTPGEENEDEPALEILAEILGGGRSSRLYRNVVRAGGASSVTASNSIWEDVGVFTIRSSFEDEQIPAVERAIVREIEAMKRYGPVDYELALARNRIEADTIFGLQDALGRASLLAWQESRGGYQRLGSHLSALGAVTPAKVREVANRYLTFENLTVHRYRPHGTPPAEAPLVLSSLTSALGGGGFAEPKAIAPPPPGPRLPAAGRDRPIQRFVLTNGMTLFVQERRGTPSVAVDVSFAGGRLRECSANAGITALMTRMMRRGTLRRSGEELDRAIEYLGSGFSTRLSDDYFGFGLEILHAHLGDGVDLLAEMLLEPSFSAEDLPRERDLQISAIRRSFDSASDRPFQLFSEAFFGPHPYGFPSRGFVSSVAGITRDDLVDWYRETIGADSVLGIVVGDVQAEAVRELMEARFSGLRKTPALPRAVATWHPPQVSRELVETRARRQSVAVVGFPAVPPQHDDWTVLRLIQDVASGLSGTFFSELRGRRSLAYTVYASDYSSRQAGAFIGYIASDAAREKEAVEGLLAEFRKLSGEGISRDDLDRARAHLAGTTRIRLQTNSAIASDLAWSYLFGLGLDFRERFLDRLRGIKLEDLRGVAKKYFNGENHTVAILRGREKTD
ncbi:MAG: M16 family metallopeptidase [Thermoanaerobaculia bacterium]